MNRTADMRPTLKTTVEADAVMSHIAKLETRKETAKARMNQKIATVKADAQERIAAIEGELIPLRSKLTGFIVRHLDLFKSPRKHKCECGEYGLQKVTTIDILDEDELLGELRKNGCFDCIKTTVTVIKPALKKRLEAGEQFTNCHLNRGDTAVYKVDPKLLKEAKTLR